MLPLEGVTIIALEQYGAAPLGTSYLASLGAEIIKVENPREKGDISRHVGPHFVPGADPSAASLFFQSLNLNKKSVTLDLQHPAGQEILHRLVAGADALVSNLRGDVPDRLGITYAALSHHNPRLVCAHLTAYGREGPRAAWPGLDYMMQAESGYLSLTGEPDAPPARFGLSVVDFMTGVTMALGVTAALLDARCRGTGRDVDVSLFDVALYNLNYIAAWFLNTGYEPGRAPRSAHPSLVPCQLYRTQDGYIFIMCNKDKFWEALCAEVGHAEWLSDPRFATWQARLQHRDLLTVELDAALSPETTESWLKRLQGKLPVAPVYSVAQALTTEFVANSDRIMSVPVAGGQPVRVLRPPIRCGESQPNPTAAPTLGQHTDEILMALGYGGASIEALRREGVV